MESLRLRLLEQAAEPTRSKNRTSEFLRPTLSGFQTGRFDASSRGGGNAVAAERRFVSLLSRLGWRRVDVQVPGDGCQGRRVEEKQ